MGIDCVPCNTSRYYCPIGSTSPQAVPLSFVNRFPNTLASAKYSDARDITADNVPNKYWLAFAGGIAGIGVVFLLLFTFSVAFICRLFRIPKKTLKYLDIFFYNQHYPKDNAPLWIKN